MNKALPVLKKVSLSTMQNHAPCFATFVEAYYRNFYVVTYSKSFQSISPPQFTQSTVFDNSFRLHLYKGCDRL